MSQTHIYCEYVKQPRASTVTQESSTSTENAQEQRVQEESAQTGNPECMSDDSNQAQPDMTNNESRDKRYPARERREPTHLKDFITKASDNTQA